MKNKDFAHLHIHTEYSQLDGFGSVENYAKKAKELGFEYLACTDHGNIDGLIQFQKACLKEEITPILGCEAYIVPDAKKKKKEKRGHITLLVKNKKGFENLCYLMSYASLFGFYYRSRIDFESLLNNVGGLVILTGCASTFLTLDGGEDFFFQLQEKIKDDLYIEIMPHDITIQKQANSFLFNLSDETAVPLVATNDCHYIEEEDSKIQEVLLAMQSKAKWTDKDRWSFGFDGLHLRTADEMIKAFKKQGTLDRRTYQQAMKRTVEVAEKCSRFRIRKKKISLPKAPSIPEDSKQSSFLKKLCFQNYKKLFNSRIQDNKEYYDRFKEEFDLIRRKKFIPYFLIVWDLVKWCKGNDIMIGPGRGSVGGCLMAYLLDITSVDPIKFNLLFSRFISEDRIDYPDIDIDFDSTKRHLVKEYLIETYGEDRVAEISTFLRMRGAAAIADVSRVFAIPISEVRTFTKIIDSDRKRIDNIKKAIRGTPEGKQFKRKYPEIVEIAMKLEGQIRSYGRHAGGVVISSNNLAEGKRGNLANRNDTIVINWDLDDVEYMGLTKLDILGLDVLPVLNEAKQLIKENYDKNINYPAINLDDKKVLSEFAKGRNVGSFQFSSYGMVKLCKNLKIKNFDMLVHANALYRPGTLGSGMVDEFIKRKNGKKWEAIHERVKKTTESTYGIIVYQEQVMELARELAGLSWADSDRIRKIIGKSKGAKELHKFKDAFVKGCVKNKTLSKQQASKLWNDIENFGGYGFNKSHAVAYSMIGFWCQWLKVHFPTEFICASLTHSGQSEEKKKKLIEARRMGLSIILPRVGISDPIKWQAREKKLYVPFIEVKGIGPKTAQEINNRKNPLDKKEEKKQKRLKGFFPDDEPVKEKKIKLEKIDKILLDIGAFGGEISEDAQSYFSFPISSSPESTYPNLFKFKDFFQADLDDMLIGKKGVAGAIRKKSFVNEEVLKCKDCELREYAKRPVLPSTGMYNIIVLGEAPGPKEDKYGRGFYEEAPAGKLLWEEFKKYRLRRRLFHISNTCKCYPGRKIKTPDAKHIKACSRWMDEEIKRLNCKIVLAFGNTSRYYFTGKKGGITEVNGTTEWNEEKGLWICWCLHPASVLHNPDNKKKFKKGIKNFAETYKRFKNER